jgi:hypothetical protein
MSCICVGFGTLYIDPDEMKPIQLALCTTRDLLFMGWYTVLLYFAYTIPDSECLFYTGITTWLYFTAIVTFFRLIKNPIQYLANKRLNNNGAHWENPEEEKRWYTYFSPGYMICSMRIYALVDWLTYFAWIVGLTSFRPSQQCNENIVAQAGFYEIGISTIVYIVSLLGYTIAFALHKASKGRCLPGFTLVRAGGGDGCPRFSFDRRQWRQEGEDLQEYRSRVVREFEQMSIAITQPIGMRDMTVDNRLTKEELDTLKTFVYDSQQSLFDTEGNVDDREGPLDRTTDHTCALCIDDYEQGETLRELHCGHRFHAHCVDEWLTTSKRTCPVCNCDAVGLHRDRSDTTISGDGNPVDEIQSAVIVNDAVGSTGVVRRTNHNSLPESDERERIHNVVDTNSTITISPVNNDIEDSHVDNSHPNRT